MAIGRGTLPVVAPSYSFY